jgi:DNA invertase Pin-like site-specific DNA recombinase
MSRIICRSLAKSCPASQTITAASKTINAITSHCSREPFSCHRRLPLPVNSDAGEATSQRVFIFKTRDQNLTGQLEALKAAGATRIYREKVSGVRADRPQLAKMMGSLKSGDIVLVTKLDRLRRSTRELLDLIERIGKAGASFRSLGDPLWDTSSAQGRLPSTLLAAIAELERELIRERTGAGRKRAMANGVRFGRKRKLSDDQRAEAIKRRAAGETLASIARSYAVDISMTSRLK